MKFTKGKWSFQGSIIYCDNKPIASAFILTEIVNEDRLENESWLEMRVRTKHLREECYLEQQANAKLIATAPELLEMLNKLINWYGKREDNPNKMCSDEILCTGTKQDELILMAQQLIKEATEL